MKKMKYSGIEWIGEIPEDWGISTYRRLLNRRKEYDDQDKQVLSLTTQGVKVKNENYGKMAEDFTGHQIVKQGDLVFTPRDFDATPISSLPSWGSKTAPKKRPETRKIPLHENLRFECVASIGVVMPLPDKSRIATCSATRFCLSRGHPLDPVSHTVTRSVNLGQISSRMTEFSMP